MVKLLICASAACLLTASAASADVQITLSDGRVSISAKDATVRQILTEWARVGQTKVVNVDRIPGGPVTLELTNVPEGQALDVLLRSVSGYVAAPRPTSVANLSVFDRIIVMATVAAPRPAAASAQPAPTFQQPQFAPPPQPADDEPDDQPQPNVQMNQPRGPVFNTFPPPQVAAPNAPFGGPGGPPRQAQPAPTPFGGTPSAPPGGGVSVPGMVPPPPQPVVQPGMMMPPGTQGQPGSPMVYPGQQPNRPNGRGGPGGR